MITALGFVEFSVNLSSSNTRLLFSSILLLISANFRKTILQYMPPTYCITPFDQFSIGNLFILVALFIWHCLATSSQLSKYFKDNKNSIDFYVLCGFAVLYVVFNLLNVVWFIKMRRTNLLKKFNK